MTITLTNTKHSAAILLALLLMLLSVPSNGMAKQESSLEGKLPRLKLQKVNKENIVKTYKDFVSKVEQNYDSYTKQDTEKISEMWRQLNDRKSEIEPLPPADNLKIAAQKAKFAAIITGLKTRLNLLE